MRGVSVPIEYKHLIREERRPEYREACIRDYIKSHPGEVITIEDFSRVAELASASTIVKKLLNQGRIKRIPMRDGKRGKRYKYEWLDRGERLKTAHAPITIHTLDLPTALVDQITIDKLTNAFHTWIEEQTDGDKVIAVLEFKKYLKDDLERVTKERQEKIDAYHDNSDNSTNTSI